MDLENINSDIIDKVISEMASYDYNSFLDEDIKEALNKKVPFSPTESYKFKQFYSFDDINTYSWNRLIDNNSLYFIYRSLDETEVPEVNVELNLNLELGD